MAPWAPLATPMPAGKGDMSEVHAQHCMTPEQ